MMIKILMLTLFTSLAFTGCTKTENDPDKHTTQVKHFSSIRANGYGESKEKAVEDAKNDALRQFGFNIVEKNGKPELDYAGKIVSFEIVQDHSEQLSNGMWWEIKIQAEIEKL